MADSGYLCVEKKNYTLKQFTKTEDTNNSFISVAYYVNTRMTTRRAPTLYTKNLYTVQRLTLVTISQTKHRL